MDRRARKLERKRKSREQAKKNARALAARESQALAALARSAGSAEFGPCYVSDGWDDPAAPALVTVIVTRKLSSGHFVPGIALVDRTCLGVKDGFAREPMLEGELIDLVDEVGLAHGGMLRCELPVALSIVFHAIEHARSLGFEPHRDFPAALFGTRPAELVPTPWCAPEQPIYVAGPHDNVRAIQNRLAHVVGDRGFEYIDPLALTDDDAEDDDLGEDDEHDVGADDAEIVHSPLETTVSRDEMSLKILIYRGLSDAGWVLEIEDHFGGSTVWDDLFATDRAALDEALLAIAEGGIESFAGASAEGT